MIFLALSSILLALLKYLESQPMLTRIQDLEQRQFQIVQSFDKWGLKKLFNMQDAKELHQRNLANLEIIQSGSHFSLLAESASSYLDPSVRRHWDFIKERLEEGFPLRLLLIDPFCSSKAIRNERNGVVAKIDPKLKFHTIASAVAKFENIELRFTTEPYCSLFFTETSMIYDPYHLGKIGDRIENYFIAIQMVKKKNPGEISVYDILRDHFEYLWSKSMRLQDFLSKYKKELDTDTVQLFEKRL